MWGVWRRWRSPEDRHSNDEIGEEIRDHLRRRATDLSAQGLSPDEAARRASIEFGGIAGYKAQLERARRGGVRVCLEQAGLEIRRAAQRLARTPVFTAFAILSVAVAVGVATAIYAIVIENGSASLFGDPSHTFVLAGARPKYFTLTTASVSDVRELRNRMSPVRIAAAAEFYVPFTVGDVTEGVRAEAVTGNYFDVARISSVRGRVLTDADDLTSSPPVALLGERYWRTRMGADESVVGSSVDLNGAAFRVVGIIPETFGGLIGVLARPVHIWLPEQQSRVFGLDLDRPEPDRGQSFWVIGRSDDAPTSSSDLAASLQAASRQIAGLHAGSDVNAAIAAHAWTIRPVTSIAESILRRTVFLLIFVLTIVVLVAAVSVANMILARDLARDRERRVQRALGASRGRLVGEVLLERALLAAAAGFVGLLILETLMVIAARRFTVLQSNYYVTASMTPGVVLFFLSELAAAFGMFGALPAARLAMPSSSRSRAKPSAPLVRRALVVFQVTASAVLLFVGAMFVVAAFRARVHDSGVDLGRLKLAIVNYYSPDRHRLISHIDVEDAILHEILRHPDIESAAVASDLPFGTFTRDEFEVVLPGVPVHTRPQVTSSTVAEGISGSATLLKSLDVTILCGRALDERDGVGDRPSVVIDERLASHLFGSADGSLGHTIELRGLRGFHQGVVWWPTVVGVAENTDTGFVMQHPESVVYMPRGQLLSGQAVFVARARANAAAPASALEHAIHSVSPHELIMTYGAAYERLMSDYTAAPFVAGLLGGLGLLALIVAVGGLYGLLLELGERRKRETAVRLALGANPGPLIRTVIREGMRPVLTGLVIGLLLGTAVRALFAGAPFSLDASDPAAILLASVPLLLIALLACYLPARAAARVDPRVLLYEV